MAQVAADPQAARHRGAAARERIRRDYSDEAVAAIVRARLDVIGSRGALGTLRREVSAFVDSYRTLVDDVRAIAVRVIPPGANAAVVSRGDADLLNLGHALGRHFPEAPSGVYAGYHPADSEAAIAALLSSQRRGVRFLLIPGTSLWWLDHYVGLREHLETHGSCLWRDPRCVIYDLAAAPVEVTA
jgi:hypothetical protein